MAKFKKLFNSALAIAIVAGSVTLTGCGGVSVEEMQQLNDLRAEVKALEKEMNSMKSEKADLERKIAERSAKLDQCAKDKEITKKNLEKILK